jgi:hypothetical protein
MKEVFMSTTFRRLTLVVLCVLAAATGFAQDSTAASGSGSGFGFNMDLGIGVQTFNEASGPVTYQSLGFTPDISFGPFGVGLAVVLNYRFTGAGSSFEIRAADWVPDPVTLQSIAALYLPKIMYVRWGLKGDPLFLKLGSFTDGTLGDGFIMGEYDNTLFLPGDRHFGFQAGLDGSLFSFPFIGLEAVIGNVAQLDVLGARLYVRPLITTKIPILSSLEVGISVAADTNPYFGTVSAAAVSPGTVSAFGMDARVPVLNVPNIATMLAYADVASLQSKSWGGMLGVGGNLFTFLTYGLQLRVLGENFIPDYFGPTYDLFRDVQYDLVTGAGSAGTVPASVGWLASIGTSFLKDKIVFRVSLDGPFAAAPAAPTEAEALLVYPHLRGIVSLAEGVVPGITFDFSYDKKAINTFASLVDPTNAAIQAKVNFASGPAVISFVYKIAYDATQSPDPWTVTSGLQTSISLF